MTVFAVDEYSNGNENGVENAIDQESLGNDETDETRTAFVMRALDDNGAVNISCNKLECFGNISSENQINIWANDIKEHGLRMEKDTSFIINSFRDNLDNYEYNNFKCVNVSGNNSNEDNPVKCDNYSNSSSTINISSVIYSKNNIDLNARYLIADNDNRQYLFAENGDITINCENFDFSGIIYSPNGNVNICANKININGFVFANNITFNANQVFVKEDYDLFKYYEDLDAELNEYNDALIKEYIDVVDSINDEDTYLSDKQQMDLNNEYSKLRSELESKDLLLSQEEVREFFESEYNKSQATETTKTLECTKASSFKPCNGIENLYDVVRSTGTWSYNKKSYQYYSMTVCDKANAKPSKRRFVRAWTNSVTIAGKINDKSKAKKYLNKAFQITLSKGGGAILSSLGYPLAGKTVAFALSKISPFGTPSVTDIVSCGNSFHNLEGINVTTKMKYYFVKYGGKWQYAYACNYAVWRYNHLIHPYNPRIRAYDTIFKKDKIELNGTFFKPYIAIKAIVNYKALYGKNSNNGYYPCGWDVTPDLKVTDYKGKVLTYSTPFYATTISLM